MSATIDDEARFAFIDWLKTRPAAIQALGKRFLPMDRIIIDGETHYVIGFGEYEDDRAGLILSKINPVEDYDGARDNPIHIDPECTAKLTSPVEVRNN